MILNLINFAACQGISVAAQVNSFEPVTAFINVAVFEANRRAAVNGLIVASISCRLPSASLSLHVAQHSAFLDFEYPERYFINVSAFQTVCVVACITVDPRATVCSLAVISSPSKAAARLLTAFIGEIPTVLRRTRGRDITLNYAYMMAVGGNDAHTAARQRNVLAVLVFIESNAATSVPNAAAVPVLIARCVVAVHERAIMTVFMEASALVLVPSAVIVAAYV